MATENRTPPVYSWTTSVVVALAGTAAAVALIIIFTYLVDVVGGVWSQAIYFLAVFGGIVLAALRSRRKDTEDPSRLSNQAAPVTPAGLPGPFVVTQALGVLGIAMIVVGAFIGGDRGITWIFGGIVAALVGGVGLVFWGLGMLSARRRSA